MRTDAQRRRTWERLRDDATAGTAAVEDADD
jgi:hypothetical protein